MSWGVSASGFVCILMMVGVDVFSPGKGLPQPAWAVLVIGWAVSVFCGILIGSYDARNR